MTNNQPYTPSLAEARGRYAANRFLEARTYKQAEAEFDGMIGAVRAEERQITEEMVERAAQALARWDGSEWSEVAIFLPEPGQITKSAYRKGARVALEAALTEKGADRG